MANSFSAVLDHKDIVQTKKHDASFLNGLKNKVNFVIYFFISFFYLLYNFFISYPFM